VERVILFAPNLVESAWALGYGPKIIAITEYCVWPPQLLDLPSVGGAADPNLERIVALRPDLVVVEGDSWLLARLARASGIRWARVDMDRDLASIFRGFARLDSLLGGGASVGAEELARRIRAELEDVRARGVGLNAGRVLLSMGHAPGGLEGLWTVGPSSFLNELLVIAGGVPYLGEGGWGYRSLSREKLLADPPRLVLELRPGQTLDAPAKEALVDSWRKAGVEVPVAVVTFDGLLVPGPRVGQSARALQRAMERALHGGE